MSNGLWKEIVHNIFGKTGYGLEIRELSRNNNVLIVDDLMGNEWLMINENAVAETILSIISDSYDDVNYRNNCEELVKTGLSLLENSKNDNKFVENFSDKIINFSVELN